MEVKLKVIAWHSMIRITSSSWTWGYTFSLVKLLTSSTEVVKLTVKLKLQVAVQLQVLT